MKLKDDKIIDVSSGVNPLGPSGRVKSAIRKAIKKINNGSCVTTERLERFFESRFRLLPDNMLFANSLKELVYLIPHVLHPGRVLIVGPALDMYEDAALSAGSEVLLMNAREEEDFSFDLSRIQKDIRNVDLVFLANPNRITGKMISWKAIREAISVLPAARPHFVIDQSMIEFAGSDIYHDDMITNGSITLLRTTAFFYGMPGLELACAVSSSDVIHAYRKRMRWEINLLSAEAARTAYKDVTYKKASLQYFHREKNTLFRRLKEIKWLRTYDTDTNIILVKIDKDVGEVTQKLRREGFAIKDCGDISGLDRSFFRISVMKHEKNLKFIAALNRL